MPRPKNAKGKKKTPTKISNNPFSAFTQSDEEPEKVEKEEVVGRQGLELVQRKSKQKQFQEEQKSQRQ